MKKIISLVCCLLATMVIAETGETFKALLEKAKQGDVTAQFEVAECYYEGKGVEQSHEEAVKWCRKAAEQGLSKAQYKLGFCYYYGYGVEQSYQNAIVWYLKAAKQGYVDAQYDLACCYELVKVYDYDKALYWYGQAAQLGHENASRRLRVLKDDAWYVRSMRKLLAYLGVDPNSFVGAFIGAFIGGCIGLSIIPLLLLFLCWLWHVFFE